MRFYSFKTWFFKYGYILAFFVLTFFFLMSTIGFSSPSIFITDFEFHHARLNGLIDAIRHGSLGQYVYYGGEYDYGYATGLYYPDQFFVPFCFLTFLGFDTSKILFISVFFYTVVFCVCTYHCYSDFYGNKTKAFVFAMIFHFYVSAFMSFYIFVAIPRIMFYDCLPLIYYGIYSIMKDNGKWYILPVSLAIVTYWNPVTAFCLMLCIFVYFAYECFILKRLSIKRFIKPCVLYFSLSSLYFCTALYGFFVNKNDLFINTQMSDPYFASLFHKTSLHFAYPYFLLCFDSLVQHICSDFVVGCIVYSVIFILFVLLLFVINKKLNFSGKKYIMVVISLWYVASFLFPWFIVDKFFPFLGKYELPGRIGFASFLFIVLFIMEFYDRFKIYYISYFFVVIMFVIMFYFAYMRTYDNNYISYFGDKPDIERFELLKDEHFLDKSYMRDNICTGFVSYPYGLYCEYMPANYGVYIHETFKGFMNNDLHINMDKLRSVESDDDIVKDINDWHEYELDKMNSGIPHSDVIYSVITLLVKYYQKEVNADLFDDVSIVRTGAGSFDVMYDSDDKVIPLFYYNCYEIVDDDGNICSYHESDKGFVELDDEYKDVMSVHIRQVKGVVYYIGLCITLISLLWFGVYYYKIYKNVKILNEK